MVGRVVELDLRISEEGALGHDDLAVEAGALGFLADEFVDHLAAHDELEFAAVRVDLAIFTVKGDAEALVDVGERNAAGIDELRAFGGFVVILWSDDFHRAVQVFAEAPLGDVDVMRTPVADHAAAVLAGHAPGWEVIVNAARAQHAAVGRQRGRAAPHVPVEAGFHGFFGIRIGFGGIAELRLHALDLADDAVADDFAGDAEFLVVRALLGAGLEDLLAAAHGFDEREGLMDVVRERLLAVHVLAGVDRGDGGDGVPVVRRGDDDGVDVLVGDEFAEVGVGRATLEGGLLVLAVAFFDGLLGVFAAVGVHVADAHDLDFLAAEEVLQVATVHFTHADEAEIQALVRSGLSAPDAGGEDEWGGDRSGGGLDEMTA